MSRMNMVEALNNGLQLGMRENENVVLLGEDVGLLGGVFRVSAGLQKTRLHGAVGRKLKTVEGFVQLMKSS